MANLRELQGWNAQSTDTQLPKHIMEEANYMFALIKKFGYVYRKDVKKGVQGACLYYTCHINGISKTPSEIAAFIGIDEKFLSAGDRILRDLNERNVIYIPAKINVISNYVNRYFELLSIPTKYKQFIFDIIEQADDDRLHVLFDSKDNTKCVGAIYLLIDRVKSLRTTIDKDKLGAECNISKTTFIKYHNMINKYYKKFIHIFINHGIPLKSAWRSDIEYSLKNKPKKVIKVKHTPSAIVRKTVIRRSTRLQSVQE
jgi:transcription initiation factor TFIIIB Brf1 subunit/transcription initiation factor TFIIB